MILHPKTVGKCYDLVKGGFNLTMLSRLLKAIIDRHDGIIDFDSCPSEGSPFYFDGLNSLAAPATSRCGVEEDFFRRQTARYQSGFV